MTTALLGGAAACSSTAPPEDVSSSEDALRVPTPTEIVGDIAYGETKKVSYTEVPSYRAFRLAGKQGDTVDVWVRSTTGGDAKLWIVRQDGKTLAWNDNADNSTLDAHQVVTLPRTETVYVVLRDAEYEDNDFVVTLAGGGGSGAAVPAARIGTTFTAKASCGFLVEWGDYKSPTCPNFGYGWNDSVDVTFSIEGTPAAPVLVAKPLAVQKVVDTSGTKKTIGWAETRVSLDPTTGAGKLSRTSNSESYHGPTTYCFGVAKGTTYWNASVTGDKVTFSMYENMQESSCCSSRARHADCSLTMPPLP